MIVFIGMEMMDTLLRDGNRIFIHLCNIPFAGKPAAIKRKQAKDIYRIMHQTLVNI
jgi:hypothetical protein